jgi:DHA1 family tetracycline resistance protein-like MFS transporter
VEEVKLARKSADEKKASYVTICLLFIIYGLSFTILIPALPSLILKLTNHNSTKSSVIYGLANFVRYILEFFVAPVLGSIADAKGRRPVFILAFMICAVEFAMLAYFPSIPMIFITRAMSGLFDAGIPTAFAIVTDIAVYRNDSVSQQYGLLGSMIGISFVLGPYFGGILSEISLSLCFALASCASLIGAILTTIYLQETATLRMDSKSRRVFHRKLANHDYSEVSINPLVGLRIHLSSVKLRLLSMPLFMCTITMGLNFILYIYMASEFRSSARSIGLYLAFHGVTNALAQGIFIKFLIPTWWNEKQATLITLLLSGLQAMLTSLCTESWELYIVNLSCCLGVIHYPSFKALIVKESLKLEDGDKYQANLQGALASIKTLAIALGSLIFPALYAYGAGMTPPIRSLPFLVAGVIYAASFLTLFLTVHEDDTESTTTSLRGVVSTEDDVIVRREEGIALQSVGPNASSSC